MRQQIVLFLMTLLLSVKICAAPLRVGLVLDRGGKDDKSFNSAAYAGATRAQKELGIILKYVEATDLNAIEHLHRQLARRNYDLLIGIGFAQTEAIKKVSAQFPQTKFAIIDGEVSGNNVRSILFEEHEGSFVVGAIAALKSTHKTVGFIGGMDIPLIRRFAMGYAAGIKYINPKMKMISNYIGVTGEAWNNPAKAKELALTQYNQGVNVIFIAAGASGTGLFDAAEEKNKFAIGVDSNQNWMKPGFILTSMLKRVDNAVYDTIKISTENVFKGEIIRMGLKNQGIDYSLDQYNERILTPDIRKKADQIKKLIIDGKIIVPDYYKVKK